VSNVYYEVYDWINDLQVAMVISNQKINIGKNILK